MKSDALEISRRIIAHHSKSFALASRLLPGVARDRAVVVYAWCRRADDAVDLAARGQGASALARLRDELDAVYGAQTLDDDILEAFRQVTRVCRIPKLYPFELLEGLRMDVEATRYQTLPQLLHYCYRVAGTVGLMMCHVMGLRDESATRNAAHLGAAMQLTNICRDVAEDWERGRLYLPDALLEKHAAGGLHTALGGAFPEWARVPVARATDDLLDLAAAYYRSGDAGIPALSWRCGVAVRTARRVYERIGARVRAQRCDPLEGRAWVGSAAKLALAAGAMAASLVPGERRGRAGARLEPPRRAVRAQDVFPLDTPHAHAYVRDMPAARIATRVAGAPKER